jgi:hypothetical protein
VGEEELGTWERRRKKRRWGRRSRRKEGRGNRNKNEG